MYKINLKKNLKITIDSSFRPLISEIGLLLTDKKVMASILDSTVIFVIGNYK